MLKRCPECSSEIVELEGRYGHEWSCLHCHFHVDMDHVNHTKDDINRDGYFHMSNEPLAEAFFEILKDDFPEIKLIKIGIGQYITVNDIGRKTVLEQLKKSRDKIQEELRQYETAIFAVETK